MILRRRGRSGTDAAADTATGTTAGTTAGTVGGFEPGALEDVLRRVVRPVVAGLVGPGDLEQLAVGWAPEPGRPRTLLVTLVARGTFWSTVLWREGAAVRTRVEVSTQLARELGDWVRAGACWTSGDPDDATRHDRRPA
jgi:hypothetical protein